MAERKTRRTKGKKRGESWVSRHSLGLMISVIAFVVAIGGVSAFAFIPYTDETEPGGDWVYVPSGASKDDVRDSLKSALGSSMGMRVYILWNMMGGTPVRANGAYRVENGRTAFSISRRMAAGRQTPVRVTFNGTRTMAQLADRIASQLECTPSEFLGACDEVLPDSGFTRPGFPAAFVPDSYEFYWSASPRNIVKRLLDYRNRFWTPGREAKARALGLSKVEVATVASIIEEETAKKDERGKVARLYLNRLRKGMRLQADPTVKFATGDFTLRRITGKHVRTQSPYNTYQISGLPPGPIRVAAGDAIDAVLDAPRHDYLYMCAKEDFSGYHNFAVDYDAHKANARRYQAELDRRNIR